MSDEICTCGHSRAEHDADPNAGTSGECLHSWRGDESIEFCECFRFEPLAIGGMTIRTDPTLPPDRARIVDPRTDKVLAEITLGSTGRARSEETDHDG